MREPSHLHPALSESEETSLGADRLDVGTGELVLSRLYEKVLLTRLSVGGLLSWNFRLMGTFDMTYSSRSTSSAKVIFPGKFIIDGNLP